MENDLSCNFAVQNHGTSRTIVKGALRVDWDVGGCWLNTLEKKTSLYADNMLLYLADADSSRFWDFLGFKVN